MIPRLPGLTLLATVSLVGAQVVMSPASSPLQPEMQLWEQQVEEEEAALSSLGSLPNAPFDPCSEMPSIAPGESAILADGGMYFNNFKSCLIYVGNVRLSDAHVRLRSAHRLFLLLPEKDKRAAAEEISDADRPAHDAPQSPTPATTSQNLDSQQESAQPVEVLTQNAAVDVPGNRVLLQGLPGSPSLTFQRGEDTLTVQPQANGQPAKAYADKSGNVLLVGTRFVGRMSYGGESYELTAQQGPVEFDAAARTVTIHGPATLKSGRGELQCTRLMRISFAPGETLTKPSNEPFSQFANMRFGPVEKAEAHGEVVCTMPEQEGRPPARATGERLTYDGSTGACRMLGVPCTLAYGKQSLSTSGEICLKPNGDASVTGSDIAGTYERPVSNAKSSATIIGSFSTRGPILYNAADNCVSLPAGIDAQDDLANFSCTGNADIFLLRKEGTPPPRKPNGPNLMIAQQCGVARLHALDNVKLHSAATDSQPPINILCDSLKADAVHGTAHLLAQDGRAASLQYGSYSLCAQSPSSRIAEVQTLDNGDLLANGDVVLTKLPGDKGTTTVTCSKNLFLERERGLLFLGPQSVIDSPDGIMTAVAKLEAELLPGPPPTLASPSTRTWTTTLPGCAVRTLRKAARCVRPKPACSVTARFICVWPPAQQNLFAMLWSRHQLAVTCASPARTPKENSCALMETRWTSITPQATSTCAALALPSWMSTTPTLLPVAAPASSSTRRTTYISPVSTRPPRPTVSINKSTPVKRNEQPRFPPTLVARARTLQNV